MRTRYRHNSFTLVELLVVIGIIAILIAVALGPITGALESGRGAKCMSNMRQIGVAFQGYLADNNNVMPQRLYPNSNTGYFVLLAPYAGNNITDKRTSIFVCPTFTACTFPTEPSYGMNYNYDNTSILSVPGQSTTVMVAETLGNTLTGSNRAEFPTDSGNIGLIDPTRHRGSANYLFFDGHVERLSAATATNSATATSLWGTDMMNPPSNPHNLSYP